MTRAYRLSALLAMSLVAFAHTASAADWYVATNGTGDGTSWVNATNSIQGAINASSAADTVWVSNGVYDAGGITGYPSGTSLTNRVAIYKAITVRSANNDPTNTIIKGAGPDGPAAVRCVWMTNGSTLIGFTLTNGATMTSGTDDKYGGGVWSQSTNAMISNCVLIGNSADWIGGGVYYGTLYNCTLTRNSATVAFGGGAGYSALNNCTLISNSASSAGGGAFGSTLTNCTLSYNTAVNYGGGAYNSALYNCTLIGNSSPAIGGGAIYGTLYNCTLISNSAPSGGGAMYNILTNCTLSRNSASSQGGGAYVSTLYNCTLTSNSAGSYGGGANGGVLYNCTLSGNSAPNSWGGGTYTSTLYNCTLSNNSASIGGGVYGGAMFNCLLIGNSVLGLGGNLGGGVYGGTMYNCMIVGNAAVVSGGGVQGGTMYNCTIVGNAAVVSGGGVYGGPMYNCVSWGNDKVDVAGTFNYSCGAGYTNGGSIFGNITNDPLFMANGSGYGLGHVPGNYRLRGNSPCINAGTNFAWMTDPADGRSKDLDVRPRISGGQVDMGCYEFMSSGTMFTIH